MSATYDVVRIDSPYGVTFEDTYGSLEQAKHEAERLIETTGRAYEVWTSETDADSARVVWKEGWL